ncbi:hypothetical protein LCGC14_1536190 [marine sediment metagenome]|uniref:Uncharacterized protein n=1 Tax=marine sediment metagenome TaxID=412755 RepID=A0A0F9LV98_9ZZZZ
MKDKLLSLRKKFEDFAVKDLKANWHGAGTDVSTGEANFSFDLGGRVYSVRIKELKI